MELGLALPTAGPQTSPETIVKVALAAERLGYSALWTFERLLRPIDKVVPLYGGEPEPMADFYGSVYEPLETLSYLAAVTQRIKLGAAVLVAPLHVPVMLARRLATLDRFSGGRVIAGLGQGWLQDEFATANVSSRRKGARTEEFITAMRAAWGPDPVRHEGECYRITPSQVNPKPVQARVPVLLAATSQAAVRRAGRIADGVLPLTSSARELRDVVSTLHAAAREAGRDPRDLTVVNQAPWPTPVTREPIGDGRPFLGGSPRQIAQDLLAARESGATQVYLAAGQGLGLDVGVQGAEVDDWLGLLGEVVEAADRLGVFAP
ncbi:probable F420-dependent oxidoreductase, Rv2161c family [Asanoa hainanensis]|uniref:Probable F420-dependent oxidoreductase, Rv2161c family n=1 Tax=Asanoa hainanensis TaxID=560556 RepID=A0A239H4Z4_9ACTN|nr:TIGR03619 family F420-dependent LLM class oxidoreductase [Asanoa hainanensis]SNS76282.1 probable F420-dependent oxidoreductase, Rv2161c family [Asanoa hainanensis]